MFWWRWWRALSNILLQKFPLVFNWVILVISGGWYLVIFSYSSKHSVIKRCFVDVVGVRLEKTAPIGTEMFQNSTKMISSNKFAPICSDASFEGDEWIQAWNFSPVCTSHLLCRCKEWVSDVISIFFIDSSCRGFHLELVSWLIMRLRAYYLHVMMTVMARLELRVNITHYHYTLRKKWLFKG